MRQLRRMAGMIQALDISKIYPDGTVALRGVDLSFGDGMLGLLGPNGAGKTTLLSILALAQEPTTGQRTYFGVEDAREQRPCIRSMIGYLPQEFEPIVSLTGFEYLQYCAELRGIALRRGDLERRILALLEAVELSHAADRRADQYSGGMQRRLGLAQALLHGPRFLVVDEPTAGLDPEERMRFRHLIAELAETIPVLLSTHIVEDIEATCPRLVIIAGGRLLFDDSPQALLDRFAGQLFLLPSEVPLATSDIKIGQRSSLGGRQDIVYCAVPPPTSESFVPTLEEACAAFMAVEARGASLPTENPEP